jgi:hypothetical protein
MKEKKEPKMDRIGIVKEFRMEYANWDPMCQMFRKLQLVVHR